MENKWEIQNTKIWWAFFGQTGYYQNCVKHGAYSQDSLRAKRSDLKMLYRNLEKKKTKKSLRKQEKRLKAIVRHQKQILASK